MTWLTVELPHGISLNLLNRVECTIKHLSPGSNGGNGSKVKPKAAETKPEETKPTTKSEPKPAPKGESKPEQPAPLMSSAQKNAIYNLSRRRGISVEELGKMAQENYGIPLENLSSTNASTFIRQLQQSA